MMSGSHQLMSCCSQICHRPNIPDLWDCFCFHAGAPTCMGLIIVVAEIMNFMSCGFVEGVVSGSHQLKLLSLTYLPPPKYSGSLGGELSARGSRLLVCVYICSENRQFSGNFRGFWGPPTQKLSFSDYMARRYFQHAHFVPIVGVGKRGEY